MKKRGPGGHKKAQKQADFGGFKDTMRPGKGQNAQKQATFRIPENTMKRLKHLKAGSGQAGQSTKPFSEETLKYHQEAKKRQRLRKVLPGGG